MGICPTVRDSAKNPNCHPQGGSEGSQPICYDAPRTS
jgi:ribosomal protein L2